VWTVTDSTDDTAAPIPTEADWRAWPARSGNTSVEIVRVTEPAAWADAVAAGRITDPGVTARDVDAVVTTRWQEHGRTVTAIRSVFLSLTLEGPPTRAEYGYVNTAAYRLVPIRRGAMGCPGWSNLDPRCHLKQIATDAFEKMARSFASAAAGAADWLWRQIDQATAINLSSPGINKDLIATGAIALVLCTGLFVIQVITATLRRGPGGLLRAVRGLGVATVMSAFAIAATKILLAAVDDLSAGVVRYATGGSIDGLGSRFALSASLAQLQNPAGLLLFSIVVLAAVVIVWAAMMMRKLLIIVAAVMTPLAFAGGAADITRSWVRRWIEFTAALIASKLLLVVMLMIGLSVFEGAGMQTTPGPDGTMVPTSATVRRGAEFSVVDEHILVRVTRDRERFEREV
jgi:hypothetical protein